MWQSHAGALNTRVFLVFPQESIQYLMHLSGVPNRCLQIQHPNLEQRGQCRSEPAVGYVIQFFVLILELVGRPGHISKVITDILVQFLGKLQDQILLVRDGERDGRALPGGERRLQVCQDVPLGMLVLLRVDKRDETHHKEEQGAEKTMQQQHDGTGGSRAHAHFYIPGYN